MKFLIKTKENEYSNRECCSADKSMRFYYFVVAFSGKEINN